MANNKDGEMIAAAILAAGFAAAQGRSITSGRAEDSLKEKYTEFLAYVRAQNSPAPGSPRAKQKK
jgi:hypothetical protein